MNLGGATPYLTGIGGLLTGLLLVLLAQGTILKKQGIVRFLRAKKDMWTLVGGVLIAVGVFTGGIAGVMDYAGTFSFGDSTPEGVDGAITYREVGSSSSVTLNSFSGIWSGVASKTEVYPVYTIFGKDNQIINNDATANTTTTYVGEVLSVYGTGASYYLDSPTTVEVNNEKPVAEFKAYAISSTANMDVVVYDNTGSTALTADDNNTNTADYAGGDIGAGQDEIYFAKLTNKVADKVFRLGAVLTYYCGGEVDSFTLTESGWTEVSVPAGALDTTFNHEDDSGTATACSIKRAYVPSSSDFIELQEWDNIKLQFTIDADDSTQPSANGDSYVGAVFVDYSCEIDDSGNAHCDWYKHDPANNDPGAIGLDENPESAGYKGLDVGFAIEPQ